MFQALDTVRRWHQPLAFFALAMTVLAVVSAVGLVVDGRVINGAPGWAKPLKFSVSFVLYSLTLGWMISQVPRRRWMRVAWWAGTAMVVASVLEMAAITLQVVRGEMSHFNNSTPFNSQLFAIMGGLIAVLYVATLVVGAALLRSPMRDASFTWALRLGLLVAVAGLSVGFLMLSATPEQAAQGEAALYEGAHGVGVVDGGPGLPLVGWSTTGGDLRVGHFIGMHALQVLPLLAVILSLAPVRRVLTDRARVQVVVLASALYAGVVGLTVWQALRAQPLLSPDSLTLAAAGALILLALVGGAAIVATGRRTATEADTEEPDAAPVGAQAR